MRLCSFGIAVLLSLAEVEADDVYAAYRVRLSQGRTLPAQPFDTRISGLWQVIELVFSADPACATAVPVKRAAASVGEVSGRAEFAFDGNPLTSWNMSCVFGEDAVARCQSSWQDGAWIGAELEEAVAIRCIALRHNVAAVGLSLDAWVAGTSSWAVLQEFGPVRSWDGGYIHLRRLSGGACDEASQALASSQDSPLESWVPACLQSSQWRLVADEATASWAVYEFELYRDDTCRQRARDSEGCEGKACLGVVIASDDRPTPAQRFHDGLMETAWTASCMEGAGKGSCLGGRLWVGLSFLHEEDIQCVRIFQSFSPVGESQAKFSLHSWDGSDWKSMQEFTGVESGAWSTLSQRVQGSATRWRLVNDATVSAAWAVHELSFARDPVCSDPIQGGIPFSSAFESRQAFDGNVDSVWVSQCAPCKPGAAFLGLSFEWPSVVRCVSLWQGSEDLISASQGQRPRSYMSSSVRLEVWDNVTASGYDWSLVRRYARLIGGLQRLSEDWGAPFSQFRVSNRNRALGGWRVAEIRLFSDPSCLSRLQVDRAFGEKGQENLERFDGMGFTADGNIAFSSDGNAADAERAFDLDVQTFWHADCCRTAKTNVECLGCERSDAWVGVILQTKLNDTVRCMQMIQTGEKQSRGAAKFAAEGISLEYWSGQTWELSFDWFEIPEEEWVELIVGRSNSKDAQVCKDMDDWKRCDEGADEPYFMGPNNTIINWTFWNESNMSGNLSNGTWIWPEIWNCSRYRFSEMCNESYRDDLDCGGLQMRIACRESCCLCGAGNSEHCFEEDEGNTRFPPWAIPAAAGGAGWFVLCCCCSSCCWKRRTCHKRRGCKRCCRCLDRCARREPVDDS